MSQSISPFSFPLLSLLLLLHRQSFVVSATSSDPNIVEETCKRCAQIDPSFNYNLCVSLLGLYPNSRNANLLGLGVISLNIAGAKATGVQSAAQNLLKSSSDGNKLEKNCLGDCVEAYTDAVSLLNDSIGALKMGRINDARTWISAAMDASTTCEDGFQEAGLSSPLEKQNDDYFSIVRIPLDIAALLDAES